MITKDETEFRRTVLINLLNFDQGINMLNGELAKFKWDSEEELVVLKREHLASVFTKFLNGQLSGDDVTEWANAIELREDIGIESENEDLIKGIMFDLANPEINYKLDSARARKYIESLDK